MQMDRHIFDASHQLHLNRATSQDKIARPSGGHVMLLSSHVVACLFSQIHKVKCYNIFHFKVL